VKKYGTGEVIPEPDDAPKEFSDEDRKALREENDDSGNE
jgi:hypothetical protein